MRCQEVIFLPHHLLNQKSDMAWYTDWFDSPYYPILYANRDHREARLFLDNLMKNLLPVADTRILDVGCGRGRHSVYLNKMGYDVTGVDLSVKSIEECKKHESSGLHFHVHDMRKLLATNYFDIALNLFTSFGYFDRDNDNKKVVINTTKALKPGGHLILDFMNTRHVIENLVHNEVKLESGIEFHINRNHSDGMIVKDIEFENKGKTHQFKERIHAYTPEQIEQFIIESGLSIIDVFGDYNLNTFDTEKSPRLIIHGIKY